MKNKKKGVALLSVIVLMSVVMAFTLLMTTLIIGTSYTIKYQIAQTKESAQILKLKDDFLSDGQATSEKYEITIKNSSVSEEIKLMIVSKSGETKYICVYNFEESKTLADQRQNFAIEDNQDYYSIAGYDFYK